MVTPRGVLAAVFLSLLPSPITPLVPKESFLLFGMLTVDRNVSSCTYLAARFEYVSSGASFGTDGMDGMDGMDGRGGFGEPGGRGNVPDVAGTLVCPEQASSSSSTSYLITIPTSGAALEAASHGLVKLYGVQVAQSDSDVSLGNDLGDAIPAPSLAARQYVLVSTSDKKVNVDVDMTAEGMRVNLASRAFSTSMDGIECRSIMSRAFGGTPEVIRWAGARGDREDGDPRDGPGRGTATRDRGACCGWRPTISCAGIGLGAVLVAWLILTQRSPDRAGCDPPRPRKAAGTERLMREQGSPRDVSTPDKTTNVREWKREGDRLRRDVKRQSADLRKT
jgi:hypothetical protein